MKVKICGLTRPEDIQIVNQLQPEYVGFVFAKSRRQVTVNQARELRGLLNQTIEAVGVFVQSPIDEMVALVEEKIIQVIQLHGGEGEDAIQTLKARCPNVPIIKAISVQTVDDILRWQQSQADMLLLDNGAGGTGTSFDWGVLSHMKDVKKPYFIAGGLHPDNVTQVLPFAPYGVDVSGGVETDGRKDGTKMCQFVENVRNYHE